MKSAIVRCLIVLVLLLFWNCETTSKEKEEIPSLETPKGMIWVPSKTFTKGAKLNDKMAMMAEKPAHQVYVDGFFMDATEVTNQEFSQFVEATQYITLAEREIDWEEMKKELPAGTPKPDESILQPGSLIFKRNVKNINNVQNYNQWWEWKIGANWRHPQGPDSDIEGKENHPVVHIGYEDALAYCKWANRRLPTEAEWESAAQGNQEDAIFTWGNNAENLNENANTWQGTFPIELATKDGFDYAAGVKSYPPNSLGFYDLLGNVWEITQDYFNVKYYANLDQNEILQNPKGAKKHFNPNNPYEIEHIIKGGSFLCHASYCASFRISARMGNAEKSSSDHVGFRTVVTPEMLQQE